MDEVLRVDWAVEPPKNGSFVHKNEGKKRREKGRGGGGGGGGTTHDNKILQEQRHDTRNLETAGSGIQVKDLGGSGWLAV